MQSEHTTPMIAIACGGTGGHLFPGTAVAERLSAKNCRVTVLISPKDVDQKGVKNLSGMKIVTLPAVGLQQGKRIAFLRGFIESFRLARKLFRAERPAAALAMGGFTSAPPILAAKMTGARTFLHESNTIAGRANRFLARFVDEAFVGFERTTSTLKARRITKTGTPVRPGFGSQDAGACRRSMGLDPDRPVILVMGGSQGASGINDPVMAALPFFAKETPEAQWLHLSGDADQEKARQAYAALNLRAVVRAFSEQMQEALGAATICVSRSGASSLAELAAAAVPSILVPYPAATDNHQFYNAKEFVDAGAAVLLEQKGANAQALLKLALPLLRDASVRAKMQAALQSWQAPNAADQIAEAMLRYLCDRVPEPLKATNEPAIPNHERTSTVQNLPKNERAESRLSPAVAGECACALALFVAFSFMTL